MTPRCETDLRRVGDPDHGVVVIPPAEGDEAPVAYWAWHATVRDGRVYANVLRPDHAMPPEPRDAVAGRYISTRAVLAWAVPEVELAAVA